MRHIDAFVSFFYNLQQKWALPSHLNILMNTFMKQQNNKNHSRIEYSYEWNGWRRAREHFIFALKNTDRRQVIRSMQEGEMDADWWIPYCSVVCSGTIMFGISMWHDLTQSHRKSCHLFLSSSSSFVESAASHLTRLTNTIIYAHLCRI